MAEKNKHQSDDNMVDHLNDNLTNVSRKVAENKKIIFWVVGIILLCGVFALSYLFIYHNPRLEKSFEEYNKVEMNAANDTVAAKEYAKVADKYSNEAGKLAALSAAESFYSIGKYAEAAKYLEKFSSDDELLEANSKILLGDCYVNLKKYDDAIASFKKGIEKADGNPEIVPRALMKMANVYDEQKKFADALGCYETIKKDFPTFVAGNLEIDAYIAREQARLGK